MTRREEKNVSNLQVYNGREEKGRTRSNEAAVAPERPDCVLGGAVFSMVFISANRPL